MSGTSLIELEGLLRERLAGTLPGLQAQLRFMPTPPLTGWKPGDFPSDARIAAGLLLLYPGERGASIPLTVRASGLRRHAGQISFPGGATDPGETLAQAALREAHEEIGVEPTSVRVLGELTPVHVLVSGFTLHPVVGITHQRPSFAPAPTEVEAVVEVSVADLQDASRIRQGSRTREGVAIEYPYFDLMGHHVWGATAMILGEFICLL
jgi:8-oxo-dGTP pyrophosphatase MutT (NUDIX family)